MKLKQHLRDLILVFIFSFALCVRAQVSDPILVLNTGGHTSKISEVLITPDGQYLISAGADKTIRVWNVDSGALERTIRGEISSGIGGRIFAAAISPDDRILAVGGWLAGQPEEAYSIRLHEMPEGRVVGLLEGHEGVVFSLTFSADGERLASGSDDRTIRVWKRAKHEKWAAEAILKGHQQRVYSLAFSADGSRLASGSADKTARLWDMQSLEQIREMSGHGYEVNSVAFAPRSNILLTGSDDGAIYQWDARNGEPRGVLANLDRAVLDVAWSPAGDQVVAGTGWGPNPPVAQIRVVQSGQVAGSVDHSNTVLSVDYSPIERLVASAGGNDQPILLWNPNTGAIAHRLAGDGRRTWSLAFSRDGKSLAFGNTFEPRGLNSLGPLERTINLRPSESRRFSLELGGEVKSEVGFERALESVGELTLSTLSGRLDSVLQVSKGSDTVARWERRGPHSGHMHLSYSLDREGRSILSGGSNGVLELYDIASGLKKEFVGHSSEVWAVAVSPDGKLGASASADQTIRLWDLRSAELLVSIFLGDDQEWVAWTPTGYYTASPNGERYIGWHVNRGVRDGADYYPVEQFRQQFYWSDVVNKTLELRDANIAFREAKSRLSLKSERARDVSTIPSLPEKPELPPYVEFVTPREESLLVDKAEILVRVVALSSSSPITNLRISVRGRIVNRLQGLAKGDPRVREEEVRVRLEPGENLITAVASTRRSEGRKSRSVNYLPTDSGESLLAKPKLALLAVGVSRYAEPSLNLSYADNDARDIADLFRTQAGRAFSSVEVEVLTDSAVDRASLLQGLKRLRQRTPDPGDVRMLFLSGHGKVDGNGDFYFLTTNYRSGEDLEVDNLAWLTILRRLTEGDATAILMVDACHAAAISGPGQGNERALESPANFTNLLKEVNARATNLITFAASTARQVSVEHEDWRNGAFTEALLLGFEPGNADGFIGGIEDRRVSVAELGEFVQDWVRRKTGDAQIPHLQAPPGLGILTLSELP